MVGRLSTENRSIARLYGVASSMFFALALFFVKRCRTHAFSALWIRGLGTLILSAIQVFSAKEIVYPGKQLLNLVLLRSLATGLGIACAFIAVKLLSITIWAIICRFQTISFLITSILMFGFKFDIRVVFAAGISFFGAILVMAPSIFGFTPRPGESLELTFTPSELLGLFIGFVWLFIDLTAFILMVKMAGQVSSALANYWLGIILCITSGLMVFTKDGMFTFYLDEIPYYIAYNVCYFLAFTLLFESTKVEKNMGLQAVLSCFFLITSLFLEMIFLNASVTVPNIVGCILVIASSIWAVTIRTQSNPEQQK